MPIKTIHASPERMREVIANAKKVVAKTAPWRDPKRRRTMTPERIKELRKDQHPLDVPIDTERRLSFIYKKQKDLNEALNEIERLQIRNKVAEDTLRLITNGQ